MFPFRRIVLPVDYSEACLAICPYVSEMAHRFSANLHLVHAFEGSTLIYGEFGWEAAATLPSPDQIRETETARLTQFAAERFPNLQPNLIVEMGPPAAVIERAVKDHMADLIMMPTHGGGMFRRLLLGSVTAKVLHDLSCALWTSRHAAAVDQQVVLPYRDILCAVDLGPDSRSVALSASKIAQAYNAKLSLVHTILPQSPTWEMGFDPYARHIIDSAETSLSDLAAELNLDVPTQVLIGSMAEGIREAAVARQSDLLVVGRGNYQGAISRVWSHLYSIIRESPCPVLSV
jgi:nucleotide-binding universal stress UspA family protein